MIPTNKKSDSEQKVFEITDSRILVLSAVRKKFRVVEEGFTYFIVTCYF